MIPGRWVASLARRTGEALLGTAERVDRRYGELAAAQAAAAEANRKAQRLTAQLDEKSLACAALVEMYEEQSEQFATLRRELSVLADALKKNALTTPGVTSLTIAQRLDTLSSDAEPGVRTFAGRSASFTVAQNAVGERH